MFRRFWDNNTSKSAHFKGFSAARLLNAARVNLRQLFFGRNAYSCPNYLDKIKGIFNKSCRVFKLEFSFHIASRGASLGDRCGNRNWRVESFLWRNLLGILYILFTFALWQLLYPFTPEWFIIDRERFSWFIIMELILFVLVFLCFLFFFGMIKKASVDQPQYIAKSLKEIFAQNIVSIFLSYSLILMGNYLAYSNPKEFSMLFALYERSQVNLHAQDLTMLLIKAFYLFLGAVAIHSVCKYYIKGRVDEQYVVLTTLAVWCGLFVMSFDHLFLMLLLLDVMSLITAGIISLSAKPGYTDANHMAWQYFLYSIFTSFFGYAGCFLFYTVTKNLNLHAVQFMSTVDDVKFTFLNGSFTVGGTMLLIKFLFLFSVFPFQQIVTDVSTRMNFGYLSFFLVSSKLPVLTSYVKILRAMWVDYDYFKYFIVAAGFLTFLFSLVFIATIPQIKKFLVFSSMNQMGSVLMLFYFMDLGDVVLACLFYATYAVASVGLYLFFSAFRTYNAAAKSDEDMETWNDLSRFIDDSLFHCRIRNRMNPNRFQSSDWFYIGLISSSLSVATLSGFPLLAGFFLKLAFLESFMTTGKFIIGFTYLVGSLLSLYAYVRVLLYVAAGSSESNRPGCSLFYDSRFADSRVFDGVVYLIVGILLVMVAVYSSSKMGYASFFSSMEPFFINNHYYVIDLHDELDAGFQFGCLFFVMFGGKFAYNKYILAIKQKALESNTAEVIRQFWLQDGYFYEKDLYKKMKFFKNSYAAEFAAVVGLSVTFYVVTMLMYEGDLSYTEQWMIWFKIVHVIIANFICWWLVYNISYSVFLYREVFVLIVMLLFIIDDMFNGFATIFILTSVYIPLLKLYWVDIFGFQIEELLNNSKELWLDLHCLIVGLIVWFFIFFMIYGVYRFFDISFGKINKYNSASTNADYLRAWVRESVWMIDAFVCRYYYQIIGALMIICFLGPFQEALSDDSSDGLIFFIRAVYYGAKVLSVNFLMFKFILGWVCGSYLFCLYAGINNVREFTHFIKDFSSTGLSEWLTDYSKLGRCCFYVFLSLILPVYFMSQTSIAFLIASFYTSHLVFIQTVIYNLWFLLAVLAFSYLIMREECALEQFVKTIFYGSVTITVFFVNLVIAYRVDKKCSIQALPGDSWHEVFVPMSFERYDCFYVGGAIGETIFGNYDWGSIFAFGYDYFALLLCVMTSAVFSFVFMISMYNSNIKYKKYFFLLLLLIEILTIMTFLSVNILGFIIFFEATILPLGLVIAVWGSSYKKWFAAKQLVFYSAICSLPITAAVVHLYNAFNGNLEYSNVVDNVGSLNDNERFYIWLAFLILFASKVPLFPLHSWLLNAHVEATTGGSIILASVMLKLGSFGIIRYLFGIFGDISIDYRGVVCFFAMVGLLYASIASITESDAKRLVAWTSIAHMCFSVLGLFTFSEHGLSGAVYMIFGHAITAAGLFYLVGILYDRLHTRELTLMGGLATLMPLYCSALFFFAMANAGFPWSLSFIGELHLTIAVARNESLFVFLFLIVSFVALLFANLRLFMSIAFGTLNTERVSNAISDFSHLEFFSSLFLIFNGFALFYGNDYYFYLVYHEVLWRTIV